jgi:uncharacterized protein YidB (DUF937 family)
MAAAALEMLKSHENGLQGLVQDFQSHGLGDVVSQWIGNGPNPPISPEQVHAVLGADKIQELALKAGVSPELAKSLLAAVLPALVDKLTPGGAMPPKGSALGEGLGLIKKLL